MVKHMSADVMMNLIEDAIISVNGGKSTSKVTPLLHHNYAIISTDVSQYISVSAINAA